MSNSISALIWFLLTMFFHLRDFHSFCVSPEKSFLHKKHLVINAACLPKSI